MKVNQLIDLIKTYSKVKFNETVDVVFRLGIDPRKSDQVVRGACSLPNGTGKTIRVLVFAKGDKAQAATEAGADYVGGNELAEKIQSGWLEFDRVVASPDMMAVVGKIGKILGPKGLMPNPKVGTVTMDVAGAVKNIKQGQVQFRTDKGSNVHVGVGKVDFDKQKLIENIISVQDVLLKLKPSVAKGTYIKNIAISSTMGPGVKVDPNSLS